MKITKYFKIDNAFKSIFVTLENEDTLYVPSYIKNKSIANDVESVYKAHKQHCLDTNTKIKEVYCYVWEYKEENINQLAIMACHDKLDKYSIQYENVNS